MVFTIVVCGFDARCTLEVDDASETRSEKLIRLIRTSRFGIHDISRTEVNENHLPRFNMPYEFGLFMGFKHSGSVTQKQKAVLVLDREPYRYQQFLSDIAGQDIRSHSGQPHELIRQVRHWLQAQVNRDLFGASRLIADFEWFVSDIPSLLGKLHKSEQDLGNFRDFYRLVGDWIQES